MKKILSALVLCLAANGLFAQDLPETYASFGQLIITNFATAPFPHPDRAQGHKYGDKLFSATEHYSDSRVAMFIPKGFRPGSKIDMVVHFHGWGNNIHRAFEHYKLIEQFSESRRNAILIVPQGPYNASDSFDGKLEDPDGFKRFIDEAMETLHKNGIFDHAQVGKIILSSHSGGYGAAGSIVWRGGVSDHIKEVWLFDSLYAKTERFAVWFDHHKCRFIDLYTDHGGTKGETEDLMASLKNNAVPYFAAEETNATPADLKNNHLIFLHTELEHDNVMQQRETFRKFLETSDLGRIK